MSSLFLCLMVDCGFYYPRAFWSAIGYLVIVVVVLFVVFNKDFETVVSLPLVLQALGNIGFKLKNLLCCTS